MHPQQYSTNVQRGTLIATVASFAVNQAGELSLPPSILRARENARRRIASSFEALQRT